MKKLSLLLALAISGISTDAQAQGWFAPVRMTGYASHGPSFGTYDAGTPEVMQYSSFGHHGYAHHGYGQLGYGGCDSCGGGCASCAGSCGPACGCGCHRKLFHRHGCRHRHHCWKRLWHHCRSWGHRCCGLFHKFHRHRGCGCDSGWGCGSYGGCGSFGGCDSCDGGMSYEGGSEDMEMLPVPMEEDAQPLPTEPSSAQRPKSRPLPFLQSFWSKL